MQKTSYYLKSLRHHFSGFARKGDGAAGFATTALLTVTVAGGGIWTLLDESPDNLTTPQTAQVMSEIQLDLSTLQKDFSALKSLETRLQTGDYTTAEFTDLQQQRLQAEQAFGQQAAPVLDRILFSPHLSETQAEDLMQVFAKTVKDPAAIDDRYDIADYGLLRDMREKAVTNVQNGSVGAVLDKTQQLVEREKDGRGFLFGYTMFLTAFMALFAGAAVGDSRHIKNWAREKPKKHIKARH